MRSSTVPSASFLFTPTSAPSHFYEPEEQRWWRGGENSYIIGNWKRWMMIKKSCKGTLSVCVLPFFSPRLQLSGSWGIFEGLLNVRFLVICYFVFGFDKDKLFPIPPALCTLVVILISSSNSSISVIVVIILVAAVVVMFCSVSVYVLLITDSLQPVLN